MAFIMTLKRLPTLVHSSNGRLMDFWSRSTSDAEVGIGSSSYVDIPPDFEIA